MVLALAAHVAREDYRGTYFNLVNGLPGYPEIEEFSYWVPSSCCALIVKVLGSGLYRGTLPRVHPPFTRGGLVQDPVLTEHAPPRDVTTDIEGPCKGRDTLKTHVFKDVTR